MKKKVASLILAAMIAVQGIVPAMAKELETENYILEDVLDSNIEASEEIDSDSEVIIEESEESNLIEETEPGETVFEEMLDGDINQDSILQLESDGLQEDELVE